MSQPLHDKAPMKAPSQPEARFLIQVLVLRGGGGHYATYTALREIVEQQHLPWDLKVIFVDEIGKSSAEPNKAIDIYRLLGISSDKFYDEIQKRGLAWIHLVTLHLHKIITAIKHTIDVNLLEQEWRNSRPDLIISVVPYHNRALWDSVQKAELDTPVVTILTDFADCSSGYWIEPTTNNYVICGTEKACEQARSRGVCENRIVKSSGLIIHPRFYQARSDDRHSERQRLGLDPHCMTGLVLFGANGSQVMLEIAKQLEQFEQLQLLLLCGRNEAVAAALHETSTLQKRCIVQFTDEIPYYMHLADFFIGKPGNVSISEAIAMHLPVIVERNWTTMPQERYAADWIEQQEVGLAIPSFRMIAQAVETLIEPKNFARYCTNVAAIRNRAVFEVPHLLHEILMTHRASKSLSKVQN
jgi:1,2-diacylglycerol 3-beta-galactosyltransferase